MQGRHAHAWPEVYLKSAGWVAFAPTPGRGIPGGDDYTGMPTAQDSQSLLRPDSPANTAPSPTSTVATATTVPTTDTSVAMTDTSVDTTAPPTSLARPRSERPRDDDSRRSVLALFLLPVLVGLALATILAAVPTARPTGDGAGDDGRGHPPTGRCWPGSRPPSYWPSRPQP